MKEIGGYFELELPKSDSQKIPDGILVNSGRHALEYVLRSYGESVRRVWLPYYTCNVVLEPIKRLGVSYGFYNINENLEIADSIDLAIGDFLIANNYFGIKDTYVNSLARKYGDRLIMDNAQAWYCPVPLSSNAIYSPRKFFGLPDGGVAYVPHSSEMDLPIGQSYGRCSHLLKRIDLGPNEGYLDFKENSSQLSTEGLSQMSQLTEKLLTSIDYTKVHQRRINNYKILDSALRSSNLLTLPSVETFSCPMVYPYLPEDSSLRERLIENKVFVAKYWPNVHEWTNINSIEKNLTEYLIPLPIDQRYGEKEMKKIISIVI